MDIWNICEEITSKQNWYSKVFDNEIIQKWRQELNTRIGFKREWDNKVLNTDISQKLYEEHLNHTGNNPSTALDNFEVAIKMLQTTAQGCRHQENCDWDEGTNMCDDCKVLLKNEIQQDPDVFGLTIEEFEQMEDGWEFDFGDWANDNCDHPRCKCIAPNSSLDEYIIYLPNGVVDEELHNNCKSIISEMAEQEPIDWHPGSNEQVRDLIHPSMYCYVKGTSIHNDNSVAPHCDESLRYQWLPSEFNIELDGKVHVVSYINNLKQDKYPHFIPLIEKVFGQFLPSLEQVLLKPLRGQSLQVIVKVGSVNLDTTKSHYAGGSWHIEGMPYEHIAATCIHYVDVEGITDSFLEFRKPTILNEENVNYPHSDSNYTSHHYGIESHHDGVMNKYLGLIRCHEKASVIFPNSIQHRVKEFSLQPGSSSSLRTILAFFVIDPDHTIISTKDVPPQQEILSVDEANINRVQLMLHRKFFVNQLNEAIFERPFSLCEH
jgi:hypothetical protein